MLQRIENPTPRQRTRKPESFPLFLHRNGQWAKKIRGRFVYFGKDREQALKQWLRDRDDLVAGHTPSADTGSAIVRDVLNAFLTAKLRLLQSGELTERTFDEYKKICDLIGKTFTLTRSVDSLRPADFDELRAKLAYKNKSPAVLANLIQRVRTVFKYAFDAFLVDRPVRFGPTFKKPSKRVMRLARHARGPNMLEADQIRKLLEAASPQVRAMILLGANGALGNRDCSELRLKHLDLERGWLNYPRPKTGIQRRIPLWKETIEALREVLADRPTVLPAEVVDRVFVTKYRKPWVRCERETDDKLRQDDAITKEFRKLMLAAGFHRRGLGFYSLRHTFETIGGDSRDQVATDAIMGHARDDMASTYRERIADDRLRAVVDHVHGWLFPAE